MEIFGVLFPVFIIFSFPIKLTQRCLSSILMVPTHSCVSLGISPFGWSDCPGDCCSVCCFGVVGTISSKGFQDLRKSFRIFFCLNNMHFLFQKIFPMPSILFLRSWPKICCSEPGSTVFANCWFILFRLLTSAKLRWCVIWLLVCACNVMISVATFVSDRQVCLYSFLKMFLSFLNCRTLLLLATAKECLIASFLLLTPTLLATALEHKCSLVSVSVT